MAKLKTIALTVSSLSAVSATAYAQNATPNQVGMAMMRLNSALLDQAKAQTSAPVAYGHRCVKTSASTKSTQNWFAAMKTNLLQTAHISTAPSPAANLICTILPMKLKNAICPPKLLCCLSLKAHS